MKLDAKRVIYQRGSIIDRGHAAHVGRTPWQLTAGKPKAATAGEKHEKDLHPLSIALTATMILSATVAQHRQEDQGIRPETQEKYLAIAVELEKIQGQLAEYLKGGRD